jgi:hypothetical protein
MECVGKERRTALRRRQSTKGERATTRELLPSVHGRDTEILLRRREEWGSRKRGEKREE